MEAVRYQNPDLQMPPKSRLSDQQIADLTRWVEAGAPWPAEPAAASDSPIAAAFDLDKRRNSHWAWQPVVAHEPPVVKNLGWVTTPIDRFVLAGLESAGLESAPAADRRSLIRRVYAVLIGLPPTPEEVAEFVADPASDPLPKLVDRLLASPHYGERWARHWMDLVRYSETLGDETDAPIPNAWRYRDYLVRAFNSDLPYNQFLREHIAGDLLPEPRRNPADGCNESIVATGFFWMNEARRSPVDLRAAEADCFDNKLDVMCKTFLGMTVACARCHDHKFDAISSGDYYALYGYLKSSRYTQAQLNASQCQEAAGRLITLQPQIRDIGATLLARRASTMSRYLSASLAATRRPIDAVAAEAGLDAASLQKWTVALKKPLAVDHPLQAWAKIAELGTAPSKETIASRWKELAGEIETKSRQPPAAARSKDIELADFQQGSYASWFSEDQAFGVAPLQPGDCLPGTTAYRPLATIVRGGAWAHSGALSRRLQGTLRSPTFTISRRYLHVLAAGRAARINVDIDHYVMIQEPLFGGLRKVLDNDAPQWRTFDLSLWSGHRAYLECADSTTQDLHDFGPPTGAGPEGYLAIGRALLSDESPPSSAAFTLSPGFFGDTPVRSQAELAERYQKIVVDSLLALARGKLRDQPDAESRATLLSWLIENGLLDSGARTDDPAMRKQLETLLKGYRECELRLPEPIRAPANIDGTGEDEYVFVRGNHKVAGPVTPRRFLAAIVGQNSSAASAEGSGRLDLAARMSDPRNPLVARVIVNRTWHYVFGRGIVPSVDNLGVLGDRPTHPELLDYLADRFVKDGWSIKKLIRELVLSRTFQMSSGGTPRADEIDPDNRLWHRMFIRRLEAESIRDHMLAVSGRLDRRLFGPSVEVFLTPYMQGNAESTGKPKQSGPLDGDGRRSLYIKVRRNYLTPMLLAFDWPAPLNTAGQRTVSNVPAQALILLNDPFVAWQAEGWAKRILAQKDLDASEKVRRMYAEAFARPPTTGELQIALALLDDHGALLKIPPGERSGDVRVWAALAHVLLNVKEFIFLD